MQLKSTDLAISTFELLVKPIAPRAVGNDALNAVARRIVQGYFLTITNLESVDLTFRLEFRISSPNPADPDRTLFGNADLVFDIAGANTPILLSGNASSSTFRGSFRLPAGQTASVQLLPKPSLFAQSDPDFEVRGYVVLSLPALRQRPGFLFEAQASEPVNVLLSPEIRGTFLPNRYPDSLSGDFDQINYALPIASGKALNQVESEPIRFILRDSFQGFSQTFSEQPSIEDIMDMPELAQSALPERAMVSATTSLLD
jgi:hypothetical protein